jgi:hypothetical protein
MTFLEYKREKRINEFDDIIRRQAVVLGSFEVKGERNSV